ncbi:MAG: peptidase M15 [Candidatus Cloacimonetes bacterium]|nr:peptidase M15 [Candidatus Cloacimonadota bacterium]
MKDRIKIDWRLVKFFHKQEFRCSCCGKIIIYAELVLKLDLARELAETAFVITSGYRCRKHNKEIGGVKDSTHIYGLAVDIAVSDNITRLKILKGLIIAGFRRIGIGEDFIHVDIDKSNPNCLWLYEV